jgi:hypothetical protein
VRLAVALLVATCACRLNFGIVADDADSGANGDAIVEDSTLVAGVETNVSTTGRTCVDVAWGGPYAGVIWREGTQTGAASIMFAGVAPTGAIANGPYMVMSASTGVFCPSIAWTGTNFLIAVPYGSTQRDIDVWTATQSFPVARGNVVNNAQDTFGPRLVERGGTVALAWRDLSGASNFDVSSRTLDTAGAVLTAPVQLSNDVAQNNTPAVIATTTGFAVAWGTSAGPHLRLLDGSGAATGIERQLSTGGSVTGAMGIAERPDGTFVLGWAVSGGNEVTTARADTTATTLDGPFSIAAPAAREPTMVYAASADRIGLEYLEASGLVQIHLAFLTTTGQLISEVAVANATTSSEYALAWSGSQFIAAYTNNAGVFVKFIPPPP